MIGKFWSKFKNVFTKSVTENNNTVIKRKRKIDFKYILTFMLVYSCQIGYTAKKVIHIMTNHGFPTIKEPSLLSARLKYPHYMFYSIFIKLVDIVDSLIYPKNKRRFFAIDGCKVRVPSTTFRNSDTKYVNYGGYYDVGMLSCMYDVVYHIPYDFSFSNDTSERTHALQHFKRCRTGDVLIFDRGYISREMMCTLTQKQLDFIFRIPNNDNQFKFIFKEIENADKIINYQVPNGKLLKLRIIKYNNYYLATSLLNTNKFPLQFVADKYNQRWNIEEHFKLQKSDLTTLQSFHGLTEHSIIQEIYTQFIAIIVARVIMLQTLDKLNVDIKVKYPYNSINEVVKRNT